MSEAVAPYTAKARELLEIQAEKRRLRKELATMNRQARKAATSYHKIDAAGNRWQKSFFKRKRSRSRGRYGKRRFRGRGDYFSDFYGPDLPGASIGRSIGSGLVGMIPGLGETLAPIGGWLGSKAGGWISKMLGGRGDYQMAPFAPEIKLNSAIMGTSSDVPLMGNIGQGNRGTVIRHREFLGELVTSPNDDGQFHVVQTHKINPGNSELFPWLSGIALNYKEYRLYGMIFEFKTTVDQTTLSSGYQTGNIIIATQYNVHDPPFATRIEMSNSEFAQSCKPTQSMLHPIECAPRESVLDVKYVRTDASATDQDQKFYDHATIYVAHSGIQFASQSVGELWVNYEIELLKPAMNIDAAGNEINYGLFSNSGSVIVPSAILSAGFSEVHSNYFTIDMWTTDSRFTLPDQLVTGNYIVTYMITDLIAAGALDYEPITFTLSTDSGNTLQPLTVFNGSSTYNTQVIAAGAGDTVTLITRQAFTVTGAPAFGRNWIDITSTQPGSPGYTADHFLFEITQIPNNVMNM